MRCFTAYVPALLLAAVVACGAATVAPGNQTVDLGEKDAGRTVQVRLGDIVRVQLVESFPVPGSSLAWGVTSASPSILAGVSTERTSQVRSGPGGKDTYTANFRAVAAGQDSLIAHGATTCEAMLKSSCPDRNFTITVVVTARPISRFRGCVLSH